MVLITRQMQVIKQVADRVAAIDDARSWNKGRVLDVFTRPQQPITKSLIDDPAAGARQRAAACAPSLASQLRTSAGA